MNIKIIFRFYFFLNFIVLFFMKVYNTFITCISFININNHVKTKYNNEINKNQSNNVISL